MKIILAFDSYKGCLSSREIIEIATAAIIRVIPDVQIKAFQLADGGEGTLAALCTGNNGKLITEIFTDLENNQTLSQIGIINDDTCIIECAQTVGLPLSNQKAVEYKTTRGIGEQIKFGLTLGIRKFTVGLGGSGTNDAGIGMLAELGYRFLDKDGNEVPPLLINLANISRINESMADQRLKDCVFTILSDVNNPLCGTNGATHIYGPQKGIPASQLTKFDAIIAHFSKVSARHYGFDKSGLNTAGAAGGLGYAFLQFLNATSVSGCDYILKQLDAAKEFRAADIIFTGEGRSDSQTINGKVAASVAKLAKEYNKPVLLISGALSEDAYQLHDSGIDYLSSIQDYPDNLVNVIRPQIARKLLAHKIEETMRLIVIAKNL